MIQDLIKQVLLVEDDMRAILNEAREFAKQIRDNASDDAKAFPQQAREEALKEARQRQADAQARNRVLRSTSLSDAKAEADLFAERAKSNIPAAVLHVVAQVTWTAEG